MKKIFALVSAAVLAIGLSAGAMAGNPDGDSADQGHNNADNTNAHGGNPNKGSGNNSGNGAGAANAHGQNPNANENANKD